MSSLAYTTVHIPKKLTNGTIQKNLFQNWKQQEKLEENYLVFPVLLHVFFLLVIKTPHKKRMVAFMNKSRRQKMSKLERVASMVKKEELQEILQNHLS